MLLAIVQIATMLLDILWWIIIAQVIISWLVAFNALNTSSQGVRAFLNALDKLTGPIYRPIKRLLPDFGGIDFSPLVVLILISVLQKLLAGLVTQYYIGT